jgi:hypothetical protein
MEMVEDDIFEDFGSFSEVLSLVGETRYVKERNKELKKINEELKDKYLIQKRKKITLERIDESLIEHMKTAISEALEVNMFKKQIIQK